MGLISRLSNFVFNHDPITMAVYLFATCLAIIFIYYLFVPIFTLVFNYFRPFFGGYRYLAVFVYAFLMYLGIIATFSIFIVGLLLGLFIMLWIIYKVIEAIGIGFLVYLMFPPFRTAKDLGLFGLIDALADIINDPSITGLIKRMFNAIMNFLAHYIDALLGVVFEGQDNHPTYDSIANSPSDPNATDGMAGRVIQSIPEIKIVHKPPKEYSQEEKIKIETCIKKNTKVISPDADTTSYLMINSYNTTGINNCYQNYQDESAWENPMNKSMGSSFDTKALTSNLSTMTKIENTQ